METQINHYRNGLEKPQITLCELASVEIRILKHTKADLAAAMIFSVSLECVTI